ncbi:MAG: SpoIIE family protein phosphatase [Phycisphaerae bacterium]|nr:SpoIIE family protein phosphatase [Phycisphaerae bacterium]
MANELEQIKAEELLDLNVLQDMQEGFAGLTGLSIMVCKTSGEPLTRPTLGHRLCRKFHEHTDMASRCLEHMLAAAKAISINGPVKMVNSFSGTPIFVSPITVENNRIATIVVCANPCSCAQDRSVEQIAEQTKLPVGEVRELLEKTPKLEDDQLEATLTLIHSLATTLAKLSLREYQLRLRLGELTILHNLTSLLAGRSDLDQILKITAEQVVQVVKGKGCSIRIYNPDTKELQIKAVANLSQAYLRKGPLKLADSPIDQAALSGTPVPIENMLTDPRVIYKKEAEREGIISGLAVGMIYRGRGVGVIHLYGSGPQAYDRFEIECLKAIASQAASAIINAQLYQESIEAERTQRQLKMAGEVQRRMLPKRSPKMVKVDIGSVYEPTYLVGGDYYDFLELSGGRLGVVIADVAGKGVPASLQMVSLKATLRAYADQAPDLQTLVKMTDKVFRRDSLLGDFATLLIGIIDPEKGTFDYVNAGHYPALLVRDSKIEQQKVSGPALAIFDKPEFTPYTIELEPSDEIVLYTDGFLDAMNFDHHGFGLDRLRASIMKYSHLSAQKIAENVLWDVRRFVGLSTQADDMSMVVVKYNP